MRTPEPDLYALMGRELQEFGEDLIYAETLRQSVRIAGAAATPASA
jgi:hypothetical protein